MDSDRARISSFFRILMDTGEGPRATTVIFIRVEVMSPLTSNVEEEEDEEAKKGLFKTNVVNQSELALVYGATLQRPRARGPTV